MPNCSAFRKRNRFELQTYEAARTLGVLEPLSLTGSRASNAVLGRFPLGGGPASVDLLSVLLSVSNFEEPFYL